MTGEREFPAREPESDVELGPGKGLATGAKKPTWRTLGSMTAREGRRASMGAWLSIARNLVVKKLIELKDQRP